MFPLFISLTHVLTFLAYVCPLLVSTIRLYAYHYRLRLLVIVCRLVS